MVIQNENSTLSAEECKKVTYSNHSLCPFVTALRLLSTTTLTPVQTFFCGMQGITDPPHAQLVASQSAEPNPRTNHDLERHPALAVSLGDSGEDSGNSTRSEQWAWYLAQTPFPQGLRNTQPHPISRQRRHTRVERRQQLQYQNSSHPRSRQSPGGYQSVLPQDEGTRMKDFSSAPLLRTESCPLPGPAPADALSCQLMRRQHSVHFPLLPFYNRC